MTEQGNSSVAIGPSLRVDRHSRRRRRHHRRVTDEVVCRAGGQPVLKIHFAVIVNDGVCVRRSGRVASRRLKRSEWDLSS